jgi:hypothetical protein
MNIQTDWPWVKAHVPVLLVEDTCGLVAENEAGDIRGAVIFDNWTDNGVQAHIALKSPMALRSGLIHMAVDMMFTRFKRKMLYGLVPGDNERALKLNKHIGFFERARLPNGFSDGVDYVIMELTPESYRLEAA